MFVISLNSVEKEYIILKILKRSIEPFREGFHSMLERNHYFRH